MCLIEKKTGICSKKDNQDGKCPFQHRDPKTIPKGTVQTFLTPEELDTVKTRVRAAQIEWKGSMMAPQWSDESVLFLLHVYDQKTDVLIVTTTEQLKTIKIFSAFVVAWYENGRWNLKPDPIGINTWELHCIRTSVKLFS